MHRARSAESFSSAVPIRRRHFRLLLAGAAFLYLLLITSRSRHLFPSDGEAAIAAGKTRHRRLDDVTSAPRLPASSRAAQGVAGYGRITGEVLLRASARQCGNSSALDRLVDEAYSLGIKAWSDAVDFSGNVSDVVSELHSSSAACPSSVADGSSPSNEGERVTFLPCGLAVGSAMTVVGTPRFAHAEYVPQLELVGKNSTVMVSQFMVELRGLRAVEGEEAPKVMHFNPRLTGDWSGKAVLEFNSCYRMQWGKAMRCYGQGSSDGDDFVDGYRRCEKWENSDTTDAKESKTTSWLNRFINRPKKPEMTWPFPFTEGRLFVLTIQAGVEGYHIYAGGRHVASFPYRMGFTLEDATGLAVRGDVDVHSVYATSLPISHPSFTIQQAIEMSEKWKAPPLPEEPAQLFIGILSATNHFAERMAIRKTWMQYPALHLGNVVARFFVALSPRKEINAALKSEAEYFGDIVILPFIDRYELVVLKTVAICEYGVHNASADYIMKGDDDTFIRVDVVLKQAYSTKRTQPLYMGNLNLLHRPLRSGKWAVTFEEWPGLVYPPYANGPGYIISSDIAKFIVSRHANQSLRLFKMEDVSMGMWVEEYNATTTVQYSHSWRFCQYGCMENYWTAHYQSPRQMICLWDKLSGGRAQCCNFR